MTTFIATSFNNNCAKFKLMFAWRSTKSPFSSQISGCTCGYCLLPEDWPNSIKSDFFGSAWATFSEPQHFVKFLWPAWIRCTKTPIFFHLKPVWQYFCSYFCLCVYQIEFQFCWYSLSFGFEMFILSALNLFSHVIQA